MIGLRVIEPGSPVLVGNSIKGFVSGVCVRAGGRVTYEVSWIDHLTHHCKWLEEFEVVPEDGAKDCVIGFLAPGATP